MLETEGGAEVVGGKRGEGLGWTTEACAHGAEES